MAMTVEPNICARRIRAVDRAPSTTGALFDNVLHAPFPRAIIASLLMTSSSQAQPADDAAALPAIDVLGAASPEGAYGTAARYQNKSADLGPLGDKPIFDTPSSITIIPQDMIVNTQAKSVNEILRYLPSVRVQLQQGYDVSQPQSRGFQGSVVQNTFLDGLHIIGTTAIPGEYLDNVQVLNGLAGALYGPAAPAGVFSYTLKRPTDKPLVRVIGSYDGVGVGTGTVDMGGRTGPDNAIGYRLNFVHGQGETQAPESFLARTLYSGAFDIHLTPETVVELDGSHYQSDLRGYAGAFAYGAGKSTVVPDPVDPTRPGYGQPNAGRELVTDTGLVKIKHKFNEDWKFVVGGLYQNATRRLYGVVNSLSDNFGNYTTTKNFPAAPRFNVWSNMAYLNGRFESLGFTHEIALGTSGFSWNTYANVRNISTSIGSASLAVPIVFPDAAPAYSGGQYRSAQTSMQSLIFSDTIHFNPQWALQGTLSTTWLEQSTWNSSGVRTGIDRRNAALSPTASVIFKPIPKLMSYFTFADSLQQGETAPTSGVANPGVTLAPYRSRQYELGAKYSVTDGFLLTLDGFRITRPLAYTDPVTNLFSSQGEQRAWGVELFGSGSVTHEISLLGGVTWLDSRLTKTPTATTANKLVVGVPHWTTSLYVDYHPDWAHGLAFTTSTRFMSARAATATNNSFTGQFATLDLGLRYSQPVMDHYATFRLQVVNATDTHYWDSLSYNNINATNQPTSAWAGAPRTLQASLEIDF